MFLLGSRMMQMLDLTPVSLCSICQLQCRYGIGTQTLRSAPLTRCRSFATLRYADAPGSGRSLSRSLPSQSQIDKVLARLCRSFIWLGIGSSNSISSSKCLVIQAALQRARMSRLINDLCSILSLPLSRSLSRSLLRCSDSFHSRKDAHVTHF